MDKSKIKILLVDDDPDVIEILSYNLSNDGYQIFTANDGLKAVTKSKAVSYTHLTLPTKRIV